MLYIKDLIGPSKSYIGDTFNNEHYLNNRKLLDYDPYYNPLNSSFKEIYQNELYDLFEDIMKQNPFLKMIPKKTKV